MLRKPGESATLSKSARSTSRRTAKESPDDIIRNLQRRVMNKKCADCGAKLPRAVNLTHGTFVCMSCSGIHREFNHRIKGIGHSSFSTDEAEMMKNAGNDNVNELYLAKYSTHSGTRQPDASASSVDEHLLRLWIRKKYIDKVYHSHPNNSASSTRQKSNDISSSSKVNSSTSKFSAKPTTVKLPRKAALKSEPTPSVDLLGGSWDQDSVENRNGVSDMHSNNNDRWDAFGNNSNASFNVPSLPSSVKEQESMFQADFSAIDQVSGPNEENNTSFVADFDDLAKVDANVNSTSSDPFDVILSKKGNSETKSQSVPNHTSYSLNQCSESKLHVSEPLDTMSQVSVGESFQNKGRGNCLSDNNRNEISMMSNSIMNHDINQVQAELKATNLNNTLSSVTSQTMPQEPPPPPPMPNESIMNKDLQTVDKSKFDAFDGLINEKIDSIIDDTHDNNPRNMRMKESKMKLKKFSEKESVRYRDSNGKHHDVKIVKVHLDDDLVPFYTIQFFDGREKQTDNDHLSQLDETNQTSMPMINDVKQEKGMTRNEKVLSEINNDVNSSSGPLLEEITGTLKYFNEQQLLCVKQFMMQMIMQQHVQIHNQRFDPNE